MESPKRGYGCWFDPIIFPIMLVTIAVMYYWIYGAFDGKQYILSIAIDIFVFISIYFTILLLLLPVLRKYYTAKTCATFWLIPVFLFYQPHMQYNITTSPELYFIFLERPCECCSVYGLQGLPSYFQHR